MNGRDSYCSVILCSWLCVGKETDEGMRNWTSSDEKDIINGRNPEDSSQPHETDLFFESDYSSAVPQPEATRSYTKEDTQKVNNATANSLTQKHVMLIIFGPAAALLVLTAAIGGVCWHQKRRKQNETVRHGLAVLDRTRAVRHKKRVGVASPPSCYKTKTMRVISDLYLEDCDSTACTVSVASLSTSISSIELRNAEQM